MPTDTRLLTLVQWLSPAFPTGAFAYSHGIETAIHQGWITDAAGLEHWLADCLTQGSGRTDAIWLRGAYDTDDPAALNATAQSYVLGSERLREGDRQGAAFVKTANQVWGLDMPDLILPVAVGHAAARIDLELETTVSLYLHAFVSNLVSVAIRLSPIGQTAGQAVIRNLAASCLTVAEATKGATEDDVFSNAFLSDIAAMKHETLEPRLFQS